MTDRDVQAEDEANARRAAEGEDRDGDTVPTASVGAVVGPLVRPAGLDVPGEREGEAQREENDAEQRPS